MTTKEMIPLIEAELRALGAETLQVPFAQILKVIEGPGSAEADAAIRAFAGVGAWPPLADPVRLEVLCRLCCARWYAEVTPDDGWEEVWPTTLASLCLEYWHDVGRRDWVWESLLKNGELPERLVESQDEPDWAG